MGNCRSSASKSVKVSNSKSHRNFDITTSSTGSTENPDSNSTSALVHSFFVIAQPILRRVISQRLLDDVGVLLDEVPVAPYHDDLPDDSLPIKPLALRFEDVHVIDFEALRDDMEAMPEFEWPERDGAEGLMQKHADGGSGVGMVVLDLIDFDTMIQFGRGIELTFPVKGPFGSKGDLEIGSGGSIDEAWVRIKVPKLRIWYVNETHKLYIAFMARPDIIPHINVNADFGRGDFLSVDFTEDGSLDDVVEKILSGFGPNLQDKNEGGSYIGDRVGALIVQALSRFKNLGNGRPLELCLADKIQASLNKALGKSRPVDDIKADIKKLEMELERTERENKGERSKWGVRDKISKKPKIDDEVAPESGTTLCGFGLCCT